MAAEMAVLIARDLDIHNADILIRSDNEGVIGAFRKGRSANFMVNLSIRCTEEIYASTRLSSTLIYVDTHSNLADPVSWGILPPADTRLLPPTLMPSPIAQFFVHA
jgi:hypothetical protein